MVALTSPSPPPNAALFCLVSRRVSIKGTSRATWPRRKTRTAPKRSCSKSSSVSPEGAEMYRPAASYEPPTLAARSCTPASASSCSSRRAAGTTLPPAQQACARAREGEPHAASATRNVVALPDLDCKRGMVVHGSRERGPQLPVTGHVEIELRDLILPMALGGDRRRGAAVVHRRH